MSLKQNQLYDLDGDLLRFVKYKDSRAVGGWSDPDGRGWAQFQILATDRYFAETDWIIIINKKDSIKYREILFTIANERAKPVTNILLYVNKNKKTQEFTNLLKGAVQSITTSIRI